MLHGSAPLAIRPYAVGAEDQSTASLFAQLLGDPRRPRRLYLEIDPYDPVAAQTVKRRFGRGEGFPDQFFDVGAVEILRLDTGALEGEAEVGGVGRRTVGEIELAWADGAHDGLAGLRFDGRDVTVLMGGEGFTYAQLEPVFVGKSLEPSYDRLRFRLTIRDASALLECPIQTTLYAEGEQLPFPAQIVFIDENLDGLPKPLAYGAPRNVAPVLLSRAWQTYQFHDGAIEAVDALYDRGAPFTPANGGANDITDLGLLSLDLWIAVPGEYITDLAKGMVRIGSTPSGLVTGDVRGDKAGPLGFVSTIADVVRRIATKDGMLSDADLDLASFQRLNLVQPGPVSLYTGTSAPTVFEVIQALLAETTFGYSVHTRTGKLSIGRVELQSPVATIEADDVVAIRRVRTALPFWQRKLLYARSFTVQGPDDVAGGASDAHKDFVAEEYRRATWEDAAIQTRRPLARTAEVPTSFDGESDAQGEADRQGALLGADRDRFDVTVAYRQFVHRVGQTVRLVYPRFGLAGGRDFFVAGVREETQPAVHTTLRLWG